MTPHLLTSGERALLIMAAICVVAAFVYAAQSRKGDGNA